MASGLEEFGIVDEADDAAVAPAVDDAAAAADTPEPGEVAAPNALRGELEQIALFAGLLPLHLERIGALAREVVVKRGDYVFHHGDDGDGLYLIVDGAIRISRNVSGIGEEALAILRPGQYFGEMSIFDDSPRSADAIAHEATSLVCLPKDDLRDLMFVDRELAYELLWRFVRTISSRLRESNDRLMMLTVSSKF
jgi:CRP-like cAMP-binding protein